MSEAKDVKELVSKATDFAARELDLYALVGLPDDDPSLRQDPKAIHRAWRKASLKHHPDKAGANFDPEKWELLENARDVLLEPAARAAYDNGRAAKLRRQLEREKVQGERKRWIDQLEADELEAKRRKNEETERARELEREKMRLAEEGRRRMAEEAERFKRENLERMNRAGNGAEDEDDEQMRELQRRLDETRRRKAEKKARKKGQGGQEPSTGTATATTNGSVDADGGDDAASRNGASNRSETKDTPAAPPKWEDLKARMIAVQKKRDAAKLAQQEAQSQPIPAHEQKAEAAEA